MTRPKNPPYAWGSDVPADDRKGLRHRQDAAPAEVPREGLTPTAPNIHLCGPFLIPKDAREAAQRHKDGLPLQADLA